MKRRGVTLLEVLVAATLLSIGLLGGLEVVAQSAAVSRKAEDRARTLLVARTKLEDLLSTVTLDVGEDRREFSDSVADYELTTNIAANETLPSLVTINVRALNKTTQTEVILSVLRRQDLSTPTATEDGTQAGADSTGGAL